MASKSGAGQGRRIGWDIGGAHLKAALVVDGRVADVVQEPCPLWQGLDRLDAAFAACLARLGPADAHAATMTGELVDLFASRAEGVAALAARAAAHLGADVAIYGGRAGWLSPAVAAAHAEDIASANWHATASLVAAHVPDALLIDMGSTTTDIIPIRGGRVAARGYTDAERLATGELVYTGLTRTPLMALGPDVPFRGRRLGIMAEYFATTADVWRILGLLPDGADQHATADGRGKSVAESRLRLSRMIGVDVGDASEAEWRALAGVFAERQLRLLHDACMLVLSGAGADEREPTGASDRTRPVIICGIGRFVVTEIVRRMGWEARELAELVPVAAGVDRIEVERWVVNCAPAVAVGLCWQP